MALKANQVEMIFKLVGGEDQLRSYEKAILYSMVEQVRFQRIFDKTTICGLKLDNTFEVVGKSHCEKVENFSEELGHLYSLRAALEEVQGHLVFGRHSKPVEPIHHVRTVELSPQEIAHFKEMWKTNGNTAEAAQVIAKELEAEGDESL